MAGDGEGSLWRLFSEKPGNECPSFHPLTLDCQKPESSALVLALSIAGRRGMPGQQMSVSQVLLHLQVVKVTPGLEHAVRATLEMEAEDPGGLGS